MKSVFVPDRPITPTSAPLAEALRLAVIDDHPILRASMAQLAGFAGMCVVAEGATGRDAIDIVRLHRLDVIVMDLVMPGQSALDVLARLKAAAPGTGVLILSGYPEKQFALSLLRAGASGYLSKECEPSEILEAIRVVASGRLYITPVVAELLAGELSGSKARHERLTERELQVLLRVARGQSCAEIASELSLSAKTVSACRMHAMQKLDLHSNAEVTCYAVKHGLIG